MTDGNANQSGVGLPAGTKIGKYEVVEKIGAGGQSVVYKCYDPLLDRHVAAKQVSSHLADNPGFVEHFRREARVLARLGGEQQGIVTIHDLLEDENGLFIVMEYVEGQTLEQLLVARGGPLATKPAAQLMWRLAGAMSAVHKAGIVHRDLKPSNVIVAEDLRPTITDFGVAASLSGQTSMLMGTTKYMAPELFDGGEVDGRTDMYSLGFIMYELLLGRERFNEIFTEITRDPRIAAVRWMKWHGNKSVLAPHLHAVNPAIPQQLSNIVAKMMAKDADLRYEDMEAVGRSIKKGLAGVELLDEAAVSEPLRPALDAEAQIGPIEPEDVEPTAEELEESPTTALPKRTLSKRARITIAVAAGAAIVLLGVGLGVHSALQKSSQAQRASDLYNRGAEAYQGQDYATAAELFERVRDDFPQTIQGARCTVRAPMARAYEALANEKPEMGFQWDYEAEEKLREYGRKFGAKEAEWVRQREQEIRDLRIERQQQQDFLRFYGQVQELADSNRLDEALRHVETRRPPGLTDEQKERIRHLEWDINRRVVIIEYDKLVALVLDAAKYYKTDQANNRLNDIEQLAGSDSAKKYVPSETLQQWKDWVRTYRGIVTEIAQVNSLDAQLGRVEAGDHMAELNATRALLAARKALAETFPPDKNAEHIVALEARQRALEVGEVDVTYEQGMAFLSEGFSHLSQGRATEARNSFAQGRDKFGRCLQLAGGDHPASRAAMGRLDAAERWLEQLGTANGLFVRGEWADARDVYTAMLDQHDYQWVQAKITACTFNILIAEAKALMDAGKFDEALDKFDQASLVDPSRYDTDIAPYVTTIERLRQRSAHITEGLDLMARKRWSEARDALQNARGRSVTDEEIAEVDELLQDVEYSKYIDMGKRAERHGQYKGARTLYMQAREIKRTEEVDELLSEVALKIAEQEDG